MIVRCIDTETTGLEPDASVVQVGWTDVVEIEPGQWGTTAPRSMLINPGKPIGIEARAIHHISDLDVAHAMTFDEAQKHFDGMPVYAAHRSDFEQQFFKPDGAQWICTWRCAVKLWPDAPRHSNQVLRYYLGLDLDEIDAMPPHRAAPDSFVSANILCKMLERASIDELIEWTKDPVILSKVNFGKHRGMRWEDVPDDYLGWIIKQADMDEHVVHTAKHHLTKRAF